jgi:hypothetical protein
LWWLPSPDIFPLVELRESIRWWRCGRVEGKPKRTEVLLQKQSGSRSAFFKSAQADAGRRFLSDVVHDFRKADN